MEVMYCYLVQFAWLDTILYFGQEIKMIQTQPGIH